MSKRVLRDRARARMYRLQQQVLLFDDHRRFLCRRHGRDREHQPCIPARRAILSCKFPIAPQVQRTLHCPHRKQIPDLGTDGRNARNVRTKFGSRTGVSSELIERVAYSTDIELLS